MLALAKCKCNPREEKTARVMAAPQVRELLEMSKNAHITTQHAQPFLTFSSSSVARLEACILCGGGLAVERLVVV